MSQILSANKACKRYYAGRKLAAAKPGEEIVISGIAGRFPNSDNVAQFMDNLFNKVDLCDDDNRRWVHAHPEIPKVSGKINAIDQFDAGYFGVQKFQVDFMDPMGRVLLERSVEAIFDAGFNPNELKGSQTGVFVGASAIESEKYCFYEHEAAKSYAMAGCQKSLLAHRISYYLQLNGPAFVCDTACSSSLYAFEAAYQALRDGKCNQAIVAGTNLCLDPYVTLQFARLGVLNMNTGCRPFDKTASGYTRSEAIVAMLLQKSKDSKRIYAKVIHSKCNSDGYKEQGITFPSAEGQIQLLENIYDECDIRPEDIGFVEAHGTGTKVGDPEELMALDKFFCAKRDSPLLTGSVKGNIGHTEPASGLCSLVKVLYGMEKGFIPPNIHYDNPRDDIEGLNVKRIEVIAETTEWPKNSNYAGVNCFGFGGANCHVLLERNTQSKQHQYSKLPKLICLTSRTFEGIKNMQDFLYTHKDNFDVIRLVQDIFKNGVENFVCRGYSILSDTGEYLRSSKYFNGTKKPLYLCIGNSTHFNANILQDLMQFEVVSQTINSINKIIYANKLEADLSSDKLQAAFIAMSGQIALIDLFNYLNIEFDQIRSYANVDFVTAYAKGILNLEETVLCSVRIIKMILDKTYTNKNCMQHLQEILGNKTNFVDDRSKSIGYAYGSIEYFTYRIQNAIDESEFEQIEKNAILLSLNCKPKVQKNPILDLSNATKAENILSIIGQLYEYGVQTNLEKLYPKLQWPVNRGTPMISPLINWQHKHNYYVRTKLNDNIKLKDGERGYFIAVMNNDCIFYKGHVIDGRNLFPALGYLLTIWEFFADMKGLLHPDLKICFRNVSFMRAFTIGKENNVEFYLSVAKSGFFEVSEQNSILVNGYINFYNENIDNDIVYKAKDTKLVKKDVYKELKLRGYNYKGSFQAIQEVSDNQALIEWNDNWVTFIDNMLQLSIFSNNNKSLFVPTGIDELIIDAKSHINYVKTLEDKNVPIYLDEESKIIKSKFIEIRGLKATPVPRKRQIGQPIIETYKFVANKLETTVEESVRIMVQTILENKVVKVLKVLEMIDDESHRDLLPMAAHINNAIRDLPVLQSEISIYCNSTLEFADKNIKVQEIDEFEPKIENNINNLYIGSNLLQDKKKLFEASKNLLPNSFIITIENEAFDEDLENFAIFTEHLINNKYVYLLKTKNLTNEVVFIDISNVNDMNNWLPKLQATNHDNIVVYSQKNDLNGILGFVNCLRREPNGDNVRGFFIQDENVEFDRKLFAKQLAKEMAINVYLNGQWGTYRHLLLPTQQQLKKSLKYTVETSMRGDLSTLKWTQSFLAPEILKSDKIIFVKYCTLNFRDIMLATGKLTEDAIQVSREPMQNYIGFEFSGLLANGKKVMGMNLGGALTNILDIKKGRNMLWEIPDYWSLEEAATIPVVYATVLYALLERGGMKEGQSILIHSGTGGIGQATINVCEYFKLNIFTTVGSNEKKDFLLKNFACLESSHIGNSRDTSFEKMIFKETNGRGVDIVLNSLSEEKLQASVRCLAKGGIFIEIGKYDLSKNSDLYMDLLSKNGKFFGVMLDNLLAYDVLNLSKNIENHLIEGIHKGYVKPLIYTVFKRNQLEEAFRHMTTGKHIGKVMISTHAEADAEPFCMPKFNCNPTMSYVILGGLGGFGLELGEWLVMRGATTLILSSRNGIKTGYQHLKINSWKKYGVKVIVSLDDITTHEGCENLIREAENEAPIDAIFNLAVVLKDGLFENQNVETFETSIKPKALATQYFDELTRKMCKQLKHFVVFSSVSCGRGNPGQTNYGLSNSIMERVCEKRRRDGLPALAIQWGAVGDVGLVAELQKDHTEIAIGGTLQQRVSSCLEILDKFLMQNETIVSSIVVAEKTGMGTEDNLIDAVANIIGVRDLKTISLHSTLPELGMDSMMAVEIKQMLETEYDVFLSPQDMRTLTFARLIELNDPTANTTTKPPEPNMQENFNNLIQKQFSNSQRHLPYINLNCSKKYKKKIVMFPGIDSNIESLKDIATNVSSDVICSQYSNENYKNGQIDDTINYLWENLLKLENGQKTFNFIAHSFGSIFALELASKLENLGYTGKIALIDGAPNLMLELFKIFQGNSDAYMETACLTLLMSTYVTSDKLPIIKEKLLSAANLDERKQISVTYLPENTPISIEELSNIGENIFYRMKSLSTYKQLTNKLNSKILLCKPTIPTLKAIEEDYKLSSISDVIDIEYYEGNHQTILLNSKLHQRLEQFFQ